MDIERSYSRICKMRKACGSIAKAGLVSLVLLAVKKLSGIENPDLDPNLIGGSLTVCSTSFLAYYLTSYIQEDIKLQLRNFYRNL